MPTSVSAFLIALALAPGYLFLWLTQDKRKPSAQSPVTEVLEVVLVGAVSTAPVVFAYVLADPQAAQRAVSAMEHFTASTRGQISHAVWILAGLLVASLLLASLLAGGVHLLSRRRTTRWAPSVMQGTLGELRAGHAPHIGVHLSDGRVVDGILHSYSSADDHDQLMVALAAPIRIETGGRQHKFPFDRVVLHGSEIRHITVLHKRDSGAEPLRRGWWLAKGFG